jgi:hypothetical protein
MAACGAELLPGVIGDALEDSSPSTFALGFRTLDEHKAVDQALRLLTSEKMVAEELFAPIDVRRTRSDTGNSGQ